MSTDAQIAESSPAAEPTVTGTTTPTLDRLNTTERATWRKTGQLPDAKAASSPATPDQAVSTETLSPPASEPGTPRPKKNAESRVQELLAERAQLRAELDAARRPAAPPQIQTPPAGSSPAPVPSEKFPSDTDWLAAHPEMEYSDYIDARANHVYEQRQALDRSRAAEESAQRETADRLTTYRERAASFIQERPDYWTVVNPITEVPMPQSLAVALEDTITRSANAPKLLYELGTHPDDFQRLIRLPERQAIYELGKLDATLSGPAPPVVKTLSTAPEPPPSLRSKPTTPVDDLDSAIKRGDFTSYKLAANRRAITGR